jgi:2-keto-4-pentenoate hydratase/2-oxohepta-3-ene-1,7-dioic acid hydratase in catechol pathway
MKIARFLHQGAVRTGIVGADTVRPVRQSLDALVAGSTPDPLSVEVPLAEVTLLPPVTASCRGLLCVGINYVDHQRESAETFTPTVPEHPIVFFKTPAALTGPYDPLPLDPDLSTEFDWEVELGVVIGKGGRAIPREAAGEHVYGYTIVNDITARDVQTRHAQWHLGKNVEGATPVGPWVVTVDELGYPPAFDLSLAVNGVRKQAANTRDMVFDIADQIAIISRYIPLMPGDVIATGTPSGVGFTRTPPEFLRDGDLVEAAIEGIGSLRNPVAAPPTLVAVPTGGGDAELVR